MRGEDNAKLGDETENIQETTVDMLVSSSDDGDLNSENPS